jgi:isopenicillin-N N-acyltransferase-like protein
VPFHSILALNIRTEIAYGLFQDGCTAISYTSGSQTTLAQNWDWQTEQAENLIILHINRSSQTLQGSKPNICMVTEAGIIGKIGLNAAGVGVCLNAIRAKGVDYGRLPCHLALRACLDSNSREEALAVVRRDGIASSCHILLADALGAVGVEASHRDIVELPMSDNGVITHTNHFIKEHPGVEERFDLPDTKNRLKRINQLVDGVQGPLDAVAEDGSCPMDDFLIDEDGYPVSISRAPTKESTVATLFSITMDLEKRKGGVVLGRPSAPGAIGLALIP